MNKGRGTGVREQSKQSRGCLGCLHLHKEVVLRKRMLLLLTQSLSCLCLSSGTP
jgi:hypothetical protein